MLAEFEKEFGASEVDEIYSEFSDQLMGPVSPKKLYINGDLVGCADLRKLPGTVPGFVELAFIYIYKQKCGFGSLVIARICDLADKFGLEIELEAVPLIGIGEAISQYQLQSFYRRFSFVNSEVSGSKMMYRQPNA